MRPVYIYALAEPDTGDVRYVGKTVNLGIRYYSHRKDKTQARRGCWVRSLTRLGLQPTLFVLETTTETEWEEAERRWIAAYRAEGVDLLNHTDGGGGVLGHVHTAEMRERIAIATRAAMTPEVREKIRVARARQTFSAKTRAKIGEKSRGNKHAVGGPGRRGHPWSPEEREIQMERLRSQVLSPEHRERISKALRGRPKTPEHIEALRTALRRPEVRAKISAASTGNQYALGMRHSDETKARLSEMMRGNQHTKGMKHSDVTRTKMRAAHAATPSYFCRFCDREIRTKGGLVTHERACPKARREGT